MYLSDCRESAKDGSRLHLWISEIWVCWNFWRPEECVVALDGTRQPGSMHTVSQSRGVRTARSDTQYYYHCDNDSCSRSSCTHYIYHWLSNWWLPRLAAVSVVAPHRHRPVSTQCCCFCWTQSCYRSCSSKRYTSHSLSLSQQQQQQQVYRRDYNVDNYSFKNKWEWTVNKETARPLLTDKSFVQMFLFSCPYHCSKDLRAIAESCWSRNWRKIHDQWRSTSM